MTANRQPDYAEPDRAHGTGQPVWRTRAADKPARQQEHAQQPEHVQTCAKADPRTAALRVDDGDQLHCQHEKVSAGAQGIGRAPFIGAEQRGHAVHQPVEGQEHGHDQVGGHENRITHVGCHALLDVAAPGQGIDPIMLDEGVDTDGQAGQDDCVDDAVNLCTSAQVRQGDGEQDDVAEKRERALQTHVGTHQADARHDRQGRAQQIRRDQKQGRQHERRAADTLPHALAGPKVAPSHVEQLHDPDHSHQHCDRAQ